MKCDEFKYIALILANNDEEKSLELTESGKVDIFYDHVDSCPDCRDFYLAAMQLEDAFIDAKELLFCADLDKFLKQYSFRQLYEYLSVMNSIVESVSAKGDDNYLFDRKRIVAVIGKIVSEMVNKYPEAILDPYFEELDLSLFDKFRNK